MKTNRIASLLCATAFGGLAVALSTPPPMAADGQSGGRDFVTESALVDGLAAGAAFPFIDTTPRGISRAHIAITDSTAACDQGAAPPASVQVLVGEAGVELVPVMTPETNTGISTTPAQCVFHATVRPGHDGIPRRITDIVVVNTGAAPLTGIHTVTVSAGVH